jgi:hypothetical protein
LVFICRMHSSLTRLDPTTDKITNYTWSIQP